MTYLFVDWMAESSSLIVLVIVVVAVRNKYGAKTLLEVRNLILVSCQPPNMCVFINAA